MIQNRQLPITRLTYKTYMQEEQQDLQHMSATRKILLSAIERAEKRSSEARQKKLDRALTQKKIPAQLLRHLWVKLITDTYKNYPPMVSSKDIWFLQWYTTELRSLGIDSIEYLKWIVENWKSIMATTFKWMTDPPSYPSVPFLIRFKDEFQSAFARKEEIIAEAKMTVAERLIESRVRKGVPREEAVKQIAPKAKRKIETASKSKTETEQRVARIQKVGRQRKVEAPRKPMNNTDTGFGVWED